MIILYLVSLSFDLRKKIEEERESQSSVFFHFSLRLFRFVVGMLVEDIVLFVKFEPVHAFVRFLFDRKKRVQSGDHPRSRRLSVRRSHHRGHTLTRVCPMKSDCGWDIQRRVTPRSTCIENNVFLRRVFLIEIFHFTSTFVRNAVQPNS